MKKYLIALVGLVVAATACQKEESFVSNGISSEIVRTLNVEAGDWEATRAAYTEGTGIALTGTEDISIYYSKYDASLEDQFNSAIQSVIKASHTSTPGTYSFSHSAISGADTYNYYFVLPHKSSSQRGGSNPQKQQLRIYPVQHPTASSFDPFRDVLIGKPALNVPVATSISVSEFKRIGAPLVLTIADPDNILAGEKINVATLNFVNFSGNLGAQFQIHAGETYEDTYVFATVANSGANALTAISEDGLAKSGSNYKVWFISLPADLPAGQKVELTINTPTKQFCFQSELPSAKSVIANRYNALTFTLSAAKQQGDAKTAFVQSFNAPAGTTTLPASQTSTDGTSRVWGFSECNYLQSDADGRRYLMTKGGSAIESSIVLPVTAGKYISSIKVFASENSYSSASTAVNMELQSAGTTIATKVFGQFHADMRKTGYVEFTDIAEATQDLSLRITFGDGAGHQTYIDAISVTLEDATGEPVTPPAGEIDYYTKYNNGETIMIGDLPVSKTVYGAPVLVSPADLTYTNHLGKGGVIFLDDKTGASTTPESITSGTKGMAQSTKPLILIGRYGNIGKQITVNLPGIQPNGDVALFNIKIVKTPATQFMFSLQSATEVQRELRIVDCFLDLSTYTGSSTNNGLTNMTNAAIGNFSRFLIENSVIKFMNNDAKTSSLFYMGKTVTYSGTQSWEIKDCTLYADAQAVCIPFYLTTESGSFENSTISIKMTGCTVCNLRTNGGYAQVYNPASVIFEKNVGYLDYSNWNGTTPYSCKLWYMLGGTADDTKYKLTGCRLYRENNPGNGVWTYVNTGSKNVVKPYQSNNSIVDGNPFKSVNYTTGYLPLIDALAGYGSSYATKGFIPVPEE